MTVTAALLLDLQVDFLDAQKGRLPVGEEGAARVVEAARALLSGRAAPGVFTVAIVNAFPRSQRLANFFRNGAAIAGTAGAELDPRVSLPPATPLFAKAQANAFSNPELHKHLQSKAVTRVCVMGVYAEGCVRATALGARALGYDVVVPLDAIATNARWKLWFAQRSMLAHGVSMPKHLEEVDNAN